VAASGEPSQSLSATPFARVARGRLRDAVALACDGADLASDFRAAVCRFEDELFEIFPAGHRRMEFDDARSMLGEIFTLCGRMPPKLALVAGFEDPRVGGFADIANQRIAIERGYLYRFLVLHESAHLIVPEDRRHGPAFTYILQLLYRSFIGVPEEAMRRLLRRHRLPAFTAVPA
jgi:hypothetical protein